MGGGRGSVEGGKFGPLGEDLVLEAGQSTGTWSAGRGAMGGAGAGLVVASVGGTCNAGADVIRPLGVDLDAGAFKM